MTSPCTRSDASRCCARASYCSSPLRDRAARRGRPRAYYTGSGQGFFGPQIEHPFNAQAGERSVRSSPNASATTTKVLDREARRVHTCRGDRRFLLHRVGAAPPGVIFACGGAARAERGAGGDLQLRDRREQHRRLLILLEQEALRFRGLGSVGIYAGNDIQSLRHRPPSITVVRPLPGVRRHPAATEARRLERVGAFRDAPGQRRCRAEPSRAGLPITTRERYLHQCAASSPLSGRAPARWRARGTTRWPAVANRGAVRERGFRARRRQPLAPPVSRALLAEGARSAEMVPRRSTSRFRTAAGRVLRGARRPDARSPAAFSAPRRANQINYTCRTTPLERPRQRDRARGSRASWLSTVELTSQRDAP